MEKIIISCLESRVETNRSMYARFLLGPFKDDQAVTIGTALRRSLLSKVKSIAITAIHIQGVTHEFSTIIGVRESVLDLALNFQQIVLRAQTNKKENASNSNINQTKIVETPFSTAGTQFRLAPYEDPYEAPQGLYKGVAKSFAFWRPRRGQPELRSGKYKDLKSRFQLERKSKARHFISYKRVIRKNISKRLNLSPEGAKQNSVEALCTAPSGLRKEGNAYVQKQSFCVSSYKNDVFNTKSSFLVANVPFGKASAFVRALRFVTVRHNKVSISDTKYQDNKSKAFLTDSLKQVGFDSDPVKTFRNEVPVGPFLQKRSFWTPLRGYPERSSGKALNDTVKIGYLQVQGPAVIYANDLKLPVSVECVDPTQYIATLSTEGLLVVKFVIGEKSVSFENNKEKLITNFTADIQNGYKNRAPIKLVPKRSLGTTSFQGSSGRLNKSGALADPEKFKFIDSTISLRNTIFLDPIFESVFQVNYIIEKDDLFNQPRERILLELWTNGSVHPRQALHKASLSLISTFSIFRNVFHLDSL